MSGFSKNAFKHPDNVFYPGFFWMWNKPLKRSELFAEMDDMVAHGSRAVCIHPYPNAFRPRQNRGKAGIGMTPDYLTEEYLDILSDVIDYAEKIGMVPWLYDEGGWPSGSACGQVLARNPLAFAQRYVMPGKNGPEVKLLEYDASIAAPYPSIIEPGVTKTFIELTHEKFRRKFSRHFGNTIRFAFMDEPDMPSVNPGQYLGWCTDLPEEFLKRKGYDIRPYMQALLEFSDDCDDKMKQVRIDYCDVRSRLFNERFTLPIREWCHANGLLSSGHMNTEDNPMFNSIGGNAHILRALRSLDVPGVDVIWRQLHPTREKDPDTQRVSCQYTKNNKNYCPGNAPFPKYASSAAHQNGSHYAMSESFAIYGDGLSPNEMKWLVDYEMVRGINLFVFSSYSPDNSGGRMTGGGPHFGKDDPYWPFMKPFFTYVARVSAMLAQGKPVVRTAFLYDIRSIWAGGTDEDKALKQHFRISEKLLKRCIDFDFVDDDQLADAHVCKDGTLKIGCMRYSAIVLPTSRWMLKSARRKLRKFVTAGGRVLHENELDQAPKTCQIKGSDAIRACRRICGKSSMYFLVNESEKGVSVEITFEEQSNIVLCNPETGKYEEVSSSGGTLRHDFAPCGSALFICNAKADTTCQTLSYSNGVTLKDWTIRPIRRHAIGKDNFEFIDYPDVKDEPVQLGSWKSLLGDEFAGTALYKTQFNSSQAQEAVLDLGRVCQCASVKLNGKDLPLKFFGPFRYNVKLRKGINTIEVTVANALTNATSPQWVRDYIIKTFPPRSSYEDIVSVFNKSNHESGLYGPVKLYFT